MLLLNLVNNIQCISMNFNESTVLTHHCYQKDTLNVHMYTNNRFRNLQQTLYVTISRLNC